MFKNVEYKILSDDEKIKQQQNNINFLKSLKDDGMSKKDLKKFENYLMQPKLVESIKFSIGNINLLND